MGQLRQETNLVHNALSDGLYINKLNSAYNGEARVHTPKELARSYLTIGEDLSQVMTRLKALYRSRGIPCAASKSTHRAIVLSGSQRSPGIFFGGGWMEFTSRSLPAFSFGAPKVTSRYRPQLSFPSTDTNPFALIFLGARSLRTPACFRCGRRFVQAPLPIVTSSCTTTKPRIVPVNRSRVDRFGSPKPNFRVSSAPKLKVLSHSLVLRMSRP